MYRLYTFNDIPLPDRMPEDDLGTGALDSGLLDSIGGTFNYRGASVRDLPRQQNIQHRGTYVGEICYLVNEAGAYIVNEAGAFMLADTASSSLRRQVDNIRNQLGKLARLYRRRDEDSVLQWKLATLLNVAQTRKVENTDILAPLTLTFETASGAWRSQSARSVTVTLANGANTVVVFNGGDVVRAVADAIATITASTTITSVRIQATGIDFTWTGTLAAAAALVIDSGLPSITNAGVAAYSGLAFAVGHTADHWLELPQGYTVFTVTVVGTGSITMTNYDQWL